MPSLFNYIKKEYNKECNIFDDKCYECKLLNTFWSKEYQKVMQKKANALTTKIYCYNVTIMRPLVKELGSERHKCFYKNGIVNLLKDSSCRARQRAYFIFYMLHAFNINQKHDKSVRIVFNEKCINCALLLDKMSNDLRIQEKNRKKKLKQTKEDYNAFMRRKFLYTVDKEILKKNLENIIAKLEIELTLEERKKQWFENLLAHQQKLIDANVSIRNIDL